MYEKYICRRAGTTRHLTPSPGAIAGGGVRIDREVSARTDPHLNFGKPLETAGRKARGLRRLEYRKRYAGPAADHKGKLPETAGRRAKGLRRLR